MKKFSVVMRENNFKSFVIRAENKEEAKQKVIQGYEDGTILMDDCNNSYITLDIKE